MKFISSSRALAAFSVLLIGMSPSITVRADCAGDDINFARPTLAVDVTDSGDCAAHEFSWNAFLALVAPVEPASGKSLYQTFMPVSSFFVGEGEEPARWGDEPVFQQLGTMFKEAGIELELLDTAGEKVLFNIAANEVAYEYLLENKLYNQQCFLNHDISFPFGSKSSGPGSILLKTSWRIYALGECPDSIVCQDVHIDEKDNDVPADRSAGLLGMHIVQKTPSHQEWMWASFEHVATAPDCSPGSSNPISSDKDWHLFKKTSANQTTCNVDSGASSACNTTAGGAANICRVSAIPAGGLENCKSDNPSSEQAVACLNASVHERLPAESVLRNYRLVGSLRMEPGIPAIATGGDQAGSLALVNSSMESFVQGPENLFNCFACHAQSSGDFSHIFFRINQVDPIQGCPLVK